MAEVAELTTSELVSEAYGKAKELDKSFPDISCLLRALSVRLDIRQALVKASPDSQVERFQPDYMMQMNHEMAYMRSCPNGQYVKFDLLATYIEQNAHLKMVQTTLSIALDLPGEKSFANEVINRVMNGPTPGMEGFPCRRQPMPSQLDS